LLGLKTNILRQGKNQWIRFFVLLAFSIVLVANSMIVNSPLIGTVASIGFLAFICVAIGEVLYSSENLFFKGLFGLATFLLLLAMSGFGLMLVGMFTEILSLVVLVVMGVFFGIIALRREGSHFGNIGESFSVSKSGKGKDLNSYLMILMFLFYVAVAFRFLLLARTNEGGASVWLEISPLFIPTFAAVSLVLALILFFVPVSDSLKLVLLLVYAFLAHSLFLLVWYPGRYGDPWIHLGAARYTARTGAIYAYEWLTSQFLIVPFISYRAQYALIVFFERMFSIDIYWVHVISVPLLWSVFVPSLAYKVAQLLTTKENRAFPLLTALSTGLFPSLILWGAVSVPNSLGFIFFFLSAVFLLKWINSGGKWIWFMSLLAVGVTFLAHPQPGLLALGLFFLGNIVHRSSRRVLKIASLFLTFALYPVALFFYGASFSIAGLFVFDNFLSFQSEVMTIFLVFGFAGLVLGLRGKYLNAKTASILFVFYIITLFQYYLTKFGMTEAPYGPKRILTVADFLLVPFVTLGLLTLVEMLVKAVTRGKKKVSFGLSSKKVRFNLNSRLIALTLICLFVSLQATSALYQAYPQEEAVNDQPSAYMLEAIKFIDSDASGRYVVLCDPIVSALATGFLGIDYSYGAARGVFGQPEWTYPTIAMYWEMTKQPSIGIMQEAMNFRNASVSYFVVWKGHPQYESIVERTSEILPLYRSSNSTREKGPVLWIFKYPLPIIKEHGPSVKVIFDDGVSTEFVKTNFEYMFETKINSTLTRSGHTSYNITEYPVHWTFLDLMVNNASREFDEASDVNKFVYVKGLKPNDVLTVKWRWNRNYPSAVWKEDSFKDGWRTHDVYPGTITPSIIRDGNVLNLSYTFTPGPYSYYYYVKAVNITTAANQSIIVRWRSDGPIAVIAYYFELGLTSGANIVPIGNESSDWRVTSLKLPSNLKLTHVMVGISNLKERDLSEVRTLSVDYILMATST